MWRVGLLLKLLGCLSLHGGTLGLTLTKEWTMVDQNRNTWISLPSKPWTLEVETDSTQGDKLRILLESDDYSLTVDVGKGEIKAADCNDYDSIGSSLELENGGSGTWSFKVDNGKMEIYQDKQSLLSYGQPCLMGRVSTRIQFPDTDKISKRFRLKPEPCTDFPSEWKYVKSPGETESGTSVEVECTDSRVNKGSKMVTCDNGETWTYEVIPHCVHQCTGINEEIFPNLFIPALPAYEGDELQVLCLGGTVQQGSETVTCEQDRSFTYGIKPECTKLEVCTNDKSSDHEQKKLQLILGLQQTFG